MYVNDAQIYSVKANSEAGNIRVHIMTTKKCQSGKILSYRSPEFAHFARKFSRGPRVQEREYCWSYRSVFENTPEKLLLQSIFPLKVAEILLSGLRKGTVGVE